MTARTAACPNCGATIEFRWSGAVQTICPYCSRSLAKKCIRVAFLQYIHLTAIASPRSDSVYFKKPAIGGSNS